MSDPVTVESESPTATPPDETNPRPDLTTDEEIRAEWDRAENAPETPEPPPSSAPQHPTAPAAPAPVVSSSSPPAPVAAPSSPPAAPAAPAAPPAPTAAPVPPAPTAPPPAPPATVQEFAATIVQRIGDLAVDDPGAEGGKITVRQLATDYPAQFQSSVVISRAINEPMAQEVQHLREELQRIKPHLEFVAEQHAAHARDSLLDAVAQHGVADARAIANDPEFLDKWLPQQPPSLLSALDSNDPKTVASIMRLYRVDHPAQPSTPTPTAPPTPPARPRSMFDHSRTLRGGLPKTPTKGDETEADAKDEWLNGKA